MLRSVLYSWYEPPCPWTVDGPGRWGVRCSPAAFLLNGGLFSTGAPGAVSDLVAIPSVPRLVPRLHHDLVLGTPPRLQAARDQPGPYEVLHKRGQALFRDHVQADLVCSETVLLAWVIDEETQLP